MIYDVLSATYPGIIHKRVYRLYIAEGRSIRKRKKTNRVGLRVPLVADMTVIETWSMDSVSGAINQPGVVSRRIKWLAVGSGGEGSRGTLFIQKLPAPVFIELKP